MRIHLPAVVFIALAAAYALPVYSAPGADTPYAGGASWAYVPSAPAFASDDAVTAEKTSSAAEVGTAALWPFGKKSADDSGEAALKPKSTRKAFFLSLLLPGLGEYYVGSKRGLAFLGIEALSWWMYINYTGKGKDIEDEFKAFADSHWRYSAPAGQYSYIEWLADKLGDNNMRTGTYSLEDLPMQYTDLASKGAYMDSLTQRLIDKGVLGISHALPGTKTQQYYEMIGKYPQFVYGWEDIAANNVALVDSAGQPKGNYDENIRNIKSPLRDEYEDLRYDSNQNLKKGQYGVNLMILNRIVSAIDAARLAYHHNKGIESELSMIRVNFVTKRVNDHTVPMLMVTKRF